MTNRSCVIQLRNAAKDVRNYCPSEYTEKRAELLETAAEKIQQLEIYRQALLDARLAMRQIAPRTRVLDGAMKSIGDLLDLTDYTS